MKIFIKMCQAINKEVFKSVITIILKNIFRLEIHLNNIFYFLKIIFHVSTSKLSKNINLK
jgi:hypothetical protein